MRPFALTLAALLALPSLVQAAPVPGLAVLVKPISTNGQVSALEVRQELRDGLPAGDVPLRFHAAVAVFGVKSIADRIVDLTVTDALGPVPLTVDADTRPSVFATSPATRHWQATRRTVAPVSVRYRIPTQPLAEGGGPPYGMKASGQGVAGRGVSFLLLPENTTTQSSSFAWDLSDLPAGSVGVITAGAGATVVAGPPIELSTQWVLAGPARVFHSTRSPGFDAYVVGASPFDVDAALDWADRGYAYLAGTLKYLGTPPYRLFFRSFDGPGNGSGAARETGGGAMMTTGATLGTRTPEDFKTTIFHEMAHNWVGDAEGAGAWFVEGLTVYLTAVLPCEAGMADAQFCVRGVNPAAAFYYSSVARNWSMERIKASGFSDENVRRVPYGRGMLYFARLNAQLRDKSNGRRTLRDVLAPLFVDRANGKRLDEAAWEAMLRRELGQAAVDEFRASVIEGTTTIVPPSDAFGPCLARAKIDMTVQGMQTKVDGYEWRPVAGCKQAAAAL